jgi:hypothetical protein
MRISVMKMKAYASFDDYLKGQRPRNRAIIAALRDFVKRVEPGLSEAVKWGNGCWVGKKGPVAYVYSAPAYVQFGFFRGSSLKDPAGLLEGEAMYVRHVKVRDPSEIDERAFAALLKQAAHVRALERHALSERLEHRISRRTSAGDRNGEAQPARSPARRDRSAD